MGWRGKGPGSRGIAGKQPFLEEYQKDLDSTSEEQPKHAAVIRIVGSFFTSDFETLASGVAASNLSATPRPSSDPERGAKRRRGSDEIDSFFGYRNQDFAEAFHVHARYSRLGRVSGHLIGNQSYLPRRPRRRRRPRISAQKPPPPYAADGIV